MKLQYRSFIDDVTMSISDKYLTVTNENGLTSLIIEFEKDGFLEPVIEDYKLYFNLNVLELENDTKRTAITNRKLFFDLLKKNKHQFSSNGEIKPSFKETTKVRQMIERIENKTKRQYKYHETNIVQIGDLYIDYILERIYKDRPKMSILNFKGGIVSHNLFSDIIEKRSDNNSVIEYHKKMIHDIPYDFYVKTNATLIICDNSRTPYWKDHLQDHNLQVVHTRANFDKLRHNEMLERDVIIVTYQFLSSEPFRQLLYKYDSNRSLEDTIDTIGIENANKDIRDGKHPILFLFHWNRCIIDGINNVIQSKTSQYIIDMLNQVRANNIWIYAMKQCAEEHYNVIFRILTDSRTKNTDVHKYFMNKFVVMKESSRQIAKTNTHTIPLSYVEQVMYELYVDDKRSETYLNKFLTYPQSTIGADIVEQFKNASEIYEHIIQKNLENISTEEKTIRILKGNIRIMRLKLRKDEIAKEDAIKRLQQLEVEYKKIYELLHNHKWLNKYLKKLFEKIKQNDLDNCPICLNKMDSSRLGIVSCGHLYCSDCLIKYYVNTIQNRKHPHCAVCRQKLDSDDFFRYVDEKQCDNHDITRYGSKISGLIKFVKRHPKKSILIISDWKELLKELKVIFDNCEIESYNSRTYKVCNVLLMTADDYVGCGGFEVDRVIVLEEDTTNIDFKIFKSKNVDHFLIEKDMKISE